MSYSRALSGGHTTDAAAPDASFLGAESAPGRAATTVAATGGADRASEPDAPLRLRLTRHLLSPGGGPLAEFRGWERLLRWRERTTWQGRARFALGRLATPWRAAERARAAVRRHGAQVMATAGVPPWRQQVQLWWLGTRHGVLPGEYLDYALYRPERRARAGEFLGWSELHRLTRYVHAAYGAACDVPQIRDKRAFAGWCAEHGLPTPPILAEWEDGRLAYDGLGGRPLPAGSLFSKPSDMAHGFGTARWRAHTAGGYAGDDGVVRTADELLAELAHTSRTLPANKLGRTSRRLLLMPCLENHPDLAPLSNGALCTIRVITHRPPGARSALLCAVHRMATGSAAVDNFSFGGMIAPVDLATGRLGPALRRQGRLLAPAPRHPDTGVAIEGHQLPEWDAVVRLAQRAHDAVRGMPAVGWDVAITPDGPVLVEGNTAFDVDGLQAPAVGPLGNSPLVTTVNAHLRGLLR